MLRTSEESEQCICPFLETKKLNGALCVGPDCMAWQGVEWKCATCGEISPFPGKHLAKSTGENCKGKFVQIGKCGRLR